MYMYHIILVQHIVYCSPYTKLFKNSCCQNVLLDLVKVTQIFWLAHFSCLQKSEIQNLTVSHPLTGAIVTIKAMLFTSPVCGFNVVADRFMMLQDTFQMDFPDLKHNLDKQLQPF